MNIRICFGLAAALLFLGAIEGDGAGSLRTWTDSQGRQIQAELVDSTDVGVVLRSESGKVYRVKLESLSQQDRDYLSSLKPSPPEAAYTVVSVEDVSYGNVVRKSYRVRVPREMTEEELTVSARKIVADATADATTGNKINAIMILFYLPDSDVKSHFTAGKATWAPDGDWGNASSDHPAKLVVEVGGALGSVSSDKAVDLPVAKKKEIFIYIARLQYNMIDGGPAYQAAAKQYGITTQQAMDITVEGVTKGWSLPQMKGQ